MTGVATGMRENAASYWSTFAARNRTQQYRPVRERSLIYCVGSRTRELQSVQRWCRFSRVPFVGWFLRLATLSSAAAEIAHARMDLIVWSVVIGAVMPVVRAFRWRYLLDPIGPTRFGPVLRATIIGFAALALLPARAGDVIRPYLVARTR